MSIKEPFMKSTETDLEASDRRKFLGKLAAGAGLLAALGASSAAIAQQAGGPPPGGPGPGGPRPPPPPEPTVSQPPPMRDVKGKTAYITASSDGIGLGIARAFSNAGMNVVIGYRNEKRLAEALPLFAKDAPVFPVKQQPLVNLGADEDVVSVRLRVRQSDGRVAGPCHGQLEFGGQCLHGDSPIESFPDR